MDYFKCTEKYSVKSKMCIIMYRLNFTNMFDDNGITYFSVIVTYESFSVISLLEKVQFQ